MTWLTRTRGAAILLALAAILALVLAACGDDDDGGSGELTVDDVSVRASLPDLAAGYFTIHGGPDADRLLSASSSAVEIAELHEVVSAGNSQEMVMVEGGIEVPANGTVRFDPGGYHVMLIDPVEPFEDGQEIEIVLEFENAGAVTITGTVGPPQPDFGDDE